MSHYYTKEEIAAYRGNPPPLPGIRFADSLVKRWRLQWMLETREKDDKLYSLEPKYLFPRLRKMLWKR